ncbi:MAG: D-alanyl-D-alanine carboxypeptidase [Gammaproteobacteria bacterium]|nr:D-alanyl-D-alanine carboxypeptidase [Gammaproteobacteria bacterium]
MQYLFATLAALLTVLLPAFNLYAEVITPPSPPSLLSSSYILLDAGSGTILAEKESHTRLPPASLTKIMTGYVTFNEIRGGRITLDDQVLISSKAWKTEGSKMFIEVDKRVKLEDLIQGMVIQSGNDASVAIAEHVAGSETAFSSLMNQHAERLGMKDSHFTNSTGLPDEALYSSAYDMAILARALINEFPEYYRWYSQKEFTYNKITQKNRNTLLANDESVDGVKTGYTEAAGYCLVTSAQRDGMRLVSVVMGTSSPRARAQETQKLLNYGFRFYESHRLYDAKQSLKNVRVWKGATEQLAIGLENPLYVTLPRGDYENLQATLSIEAALIAPIAVGQNVGKIRIELHGKLLQETPLIALEEVAEGGFFSQITDHVLMLFN